MIQYSDEFTSSAGLAQDNKYHTLSVGRHTYEAFKCAQKHVPEDIIGYKTEILYALAYHDVGKEICKEFHEGSKYAYFTGHEKISAQAFLYDASRYDCLAENESVDIEFIAALIKEHMQLYNNDVDLKDLESIYGEDFVKCLIYMNVCDENGK
jgi:hypothetical protein